MAKDIILMIAFKASDPRSKDRPGDVIYQCHVCGEDIKIAEVSNKQFKARNCKALCFDCFEKQKVNAKFHRPSREVIDTIRKETGKDIGEPEIRDGMKRLASIVRTK